MKYFIRELHGSFFRQRLIALEAGTPSSEENDSKETIIAHSYQVPDCLLTKEIIGNNADLTLHWYKGPDKTMSGYLHGGHHVGEWKEITQEKAEEILKLLED